MAKNNYSIVLGSRNESYRTVQNKKQAFDLFNTCCKDHEIVHLLNNGKVIARQSKPRVEQQKIGQELKITVQQRQTEQKALTGLFGLEMAK